MTDLNARPEGLTLDSPVYGAQVMEVEGRTGGHGPHKPKTSFSTTRKAVHRGRKITVRTTYRIEIDGEPLSVHVSVSDDGTVHCHGLPNYSFASAVDMASRTSQL